MDAAAVAAIVAMCIVALTFLLLLLFKRPAMLSPQTLLILNMLSFTIFQVYLYEFPLFGTDKPYRYWKRITYRTAGRITLLGMLVFTLINQIEFMRQIQKLCSSVEAHKWA
jgi:hypothetical protein